MNKRILNEGLFETPSICCAQVVPEILNTQGSYVAVPPVMASAAQIHNARMQQIADVMEEKNSQVADFLEMNMDRTPRGTKIAKENKSYKKMHLSEALFGSAAESDEPVSDIPGYRVVISKWNPERKSSDTLLSQYMKSISQVKNILDNIKNFSDATEAAVFYYDNGNLAKNDERGDSPYAIEIYYSDKLETDDWKNYTDKLCELLYD